MISYSFWQQMGRDSALIGRPIVLNGEQYTVTGVLAPRLHSIAGFGIAPSVYVALNRELTPEIADARESVVQLVGRLKPGQTLAQGRAAMDAVDRQLGRLQGDTVYAGVQKFEHLGGLSSVTAGKTIVVFFFLSCSP